MSVKCSRRHDRVYHWHLAKSNRRSARARSYSDAERLDCARWGSRAEFRCHCAPDCRSCGTSSTWASARRSAAFSLPRLSLPTLIENQQFNKTSKFNSHIKLAQNMSLTHRNYVFIFFKLISKKNKQTLKLTWHRRATQHRFKWTNTFEIRLKNF